MPNRPPASVIIVVYNGRQYLDDCLSSVISQLQPHDEIILVDNNSTDGSLDFVAGRFPQVNLVRQPQNGGFAQGCAVGVAHSTAELFVFLNELPRRKRTGYRSANPLMIEQYGYIMTFSDKMTHVEILSRRKAAGY